MLPENGNFFLRAKPVWSAGVGLREQDKQGTQHNITAVVTKRSERNAAIFDCTGGLKPVVGV